MFDKIKELVNRYDELTGEMSDPDVISSDKYTEIVKEHSELLPIVSAYNEYTGLEKELEDNRQMLESSDDPEFIDLLKEEIDLLEGKMEKLEKTLREMMTPEDPKDKRSVIVEIRAGAGGEEAALFASVLYKMYSNYALERKWSIDVIDFNETELGGYKELVFTIEGKGVYSRMKYESGVHRVQRVPETESGGRIHTSAVTVAVLPQAEDVEVSVNPADLEIDTYRASGAGGQHVNTTDSAIRITHKPSGIVVTCQDQRSQYKNKEKAMKVLKSKLYESEQEKQIDEIADNRKTQVGTGDRSERVRTYNYHQGRVTDHRIGLTLYKLEEILRGNLDELVQPLITAGRAESFGAGE